MYRSTPLVASSFDCASGTPFNPTVGTRFVRVLPFGATVAAVIASSYGMRPCRRSSTLSPDDSVYVSWSVLVVAPSKTSADSCHHVQASQKLYPGFLRPPSTCLIASTMTSPCCEVLSSCPMTSMITAVGASTVCAVSFGQDVAASSSSSRT